MMAAKPSIVDVCVIGAGMSGLAACDRLQKAGLSFIVLEAKNRIGGRFKAHNESGPIYDEGAHWLHCANINPLVEVLEPHEPTYIKKPGDIYFATPSQFLGTRESQRVWRYYHKVWAQIAKGTAKRRVDKAVSTLVTDPRWGLFFNSIFAASVGNLPGQVSIKDVANYVDSEIDFAVESGLGQQLSRAFSSVPVHLNQTVVEVNCDEGVQIRTASGDVFLAQSCLLTLSPPVLETIKFSPPLPDAHQDSLKTIKMGLLETVALEFHDDVFEGPDDVHLYVGANQGPQLSYLIKPAGRKAAVAYLAGEELRELSGQTDRLVAAALKPLARLYKFDPKRDLRRAMHSDWAHDPHVMGALSYTPVGRSHARSDLKVPIDGKIFFAGEATSISAPASLHGAYNEGLRAADEIHKTLASV